MPSWSIGRVMSAKPRWQSPRSQFDSSIQITENLMDAQTPGGF
ncbi:hypothetical protein RBSWK_00369 [Rhodopirellula baltica SWK14]|uniref:Uncharacterized protein n=1 Tax=Rhodopirellula baltica SWK14 TaxID=993516 RepID=L7CMY5_RHOBT|nr:hypothetical protein RBSWK_00369 [Rhodopirellula baltica SWK14]